jgi:glycosyltransferase involved in cell wall biosynthesis
MKLSVIIIAKNAEDQIVDAIESVRKIANEVIVIDNGSTDRTVEVAKYVKAEVFDVKGKDFAKLRNAGLKVAKGEWVFYIDADERIT